MISNKKALALEAFVRIIGMVVLFVAVFHIGSKVYSAVVGSDAAASVENLANEINSLKNDEATQTLLSLDKETAVVGFSKDMDYQCYGCGTASKNELQARFKRPLNTECEKGSCICLCIDVKTTPKVGKDDPNEPNMEISCGGIQCSELNNGIVFKVELGDLIKKKYGSQYKIEPSWVGGFLYSREVDGVDQFISGLPKNSQRKITVYIEKKTIGSATFIGVCPELPCVQEQK